LSERFSIPVETVAAIAATKKSGACVLAVGTTVVRALEGSFVANGGALVAGDGETDWLGGPNVPLHVVDAIFSGMHEPGSSHFSLLEAFAPHELLNRALVHAQKNGYLAHEFGDACLVRKSPKSR
jgi:S-adenosylmethionine:tRNA ribosyltransferase-isomerase